MNKLKEIKIFFLLSSFFSCIFFNALVAQQPLQTELKQIEEEIQSLKDRLHKNQTEEMKREVEGQGLMIADWRGYAQDLQEIRKLEETDHQLQKKIKQLEERKLHLLENQNSPHDQR